MTNHTAHRIAVGGAILGIVALGAPSLAQAPADLWEAVARGELHTLRGALENGVDPDVLEPNGGTPLLVAAMFGQTDLVRFLIEHEASLDLQNNDGATALHVAALFGHPPAVEVLLAAGSARDIRNNDGYTALELVSDPWSAEVEGLYGFLASIFQMDLDIERIRQARPEVRAMLRAAP